MLPHRVSAACALAALALSGCSAEEARHVEPSSAPSDLESTGADPVTVRGNSYRAALKRAAMRGLSYDSGQVRVDPTEARQVVPTPDAAAAAAELSRGRALMETGEHIEAAAAFTRAVLHAPDRAPTYDVLADALITLGKDAEAVAAWRTSLALDGGVAEVHFRYGEGLARLGRRAEAVASMREAIRLDPALGAAHARLAIQLYYLGDPAAAWASVHRAEEQGAHVPPQFRVLLAEKMSDPSGGSER